MEDIKITLETLYDILRNEKKREDLQKLEASFFIDVVSYLREKKALLESKEKSDEIFAVGERDKLEYELRSIKRILKEIYEKREKKIIDIALNRSRTGSDIIDTSSMLREEKDFYQRVLSVLDTYRGGVLFNLFKGELPGFIGVKSKGVEPAQSNAPTTLTKFEGAEEKEVPGKEETGEKEATKKTTENDDAEVKEKSEAPKEKTEETQKTKIKFTHPMPSFVWKDMKVYGPFEEGDETEIFPEVAELIVRKGRAVKV